MPDKHTVAFLGLGHMGGPMALNLVRAGYRVTAFDVVPAALEAAQANGIPVASSWGGTQPGADPVVNKLTSGRPLLGA